MFDTHCHLNFSAFKKQLDEIIKSAFDKGVTHIVIPGTDVKRSQKAVEIAWRYDNMYAAVGIHPHHVYEMSSSAKTPADVIKEIEVSLQQKKVVAIGEVGMDRHVYEQTKYPNYKIDETFIDLQKEMLIKQIKLAIQYDKSLILHNREAKADMLPILREYWDDKLRGRSVFHCCEPDIDLLSFAQEHGMYIGVDGDLTFYKEKQEFYRSLGEKVLTMLVLETDAPFLLPEPLRSRREFPNKPEHIVITAEFMATLINLPVTRVIAATAENARKLFNIH